jgi:hypothetical protein
MGTVLLYCAADERAWAALAERIDQESAATRDLLMRFPDVHDGYDRLPTVHEARGENQRAARARFRCNISTLRHGRNGSHVGDGSTNCFIVCGALPLSRPYQVRLGTRPISSAMPIQRTVDRGLGPLKVAVIRKLRGRKWKAVGHECGGTSRTCATVASSTRAQL